MSPVPVFAVVGAPSEGKTTLIATLAEDPAAETSPRPHTTQRRRTYDVCIDGRPAMRFIDTPGFEYAGEVLSRLEQLRDSGRDHRSAVEAFYNEAVKDRRYRYEVELLAPLLKEDAAAIVVVDASRGNDKTLEPVMEILSWTCQPRAVVVNYHTGDETEVDQMCQVAQRWAGIARKIDAAKATWTERFDLLADLLLVCKRDHCDRPEIERMLQALRDRWGSRRRRAAELVTELVCNCVAFTRRDTVPADEDLEPARRRATKQFETEIRHKERDAHREILRTYGHGERLCADPSELKLPDLFSKEAIRMFGLTPWQLAVAGATAGGAGGAMIDLGTGGSLLGIPTASGAIGGALAGWLGHSRIPTRVRWLPLPGGLRGFSIVDKLSTKAVRTVEITVGPIQREDFPVILFRRAMRVFATAARTPHGYRGEPPSATASSDSAVGSGGLEEHEKRLMQLCATLRRCDKSSRRAQNARQELASLVENQCKILG